MDKENSLLLICKLISLILLAYLCQTGSTISKNSQQKRAEFFHYARSSQ